MNLIMAEVINQSNGMTAKVMREAGQCRFLQSLKKVYTYLQFLIRLWVFFSSCILITSKLYIPLTTVLSFLENRFQILFSAIPLCFWLEVFLPSNFFSKNEFKRNYFCFRSQFIKLLAKNQNVTILLTQLRAALTLHDYLKKKKKCDQCAV